MTREQRERKAARTRMMNGYRLAGDDTHDLDVWGQITAWIRRGVHRADAMRYRLKQRRPVKP